MKKQDANENIMKPFKASHVAGFINRLDLKTVAVIMWLVTLSGLLVIIHIIPYILNYFLKVWGEIWRVYGFVSSPPHVIGHAVTHLNLLSLFIRPHHLMTLVSQKATLLTDAVFIITAVQLQHLLMQWTELWGARGQSGVQSGLGGGHVWTRSRFWAVLPTQSQLLHRLHKHVASG